MWDLSLCKTVMTLLLSLPSVLRLYVSKNFAKTILEMHMEIARKKITKKRDLFPIQMQPGSLTSLNNSFIFSIQQKHSEQMTLGAPKLKQTVKY